MSSEPTAVPVPLLQVRLPHRGFANSWARLDPCRAGIPESAGDCDPWSNASPEHVTSGPDELAAPGALWTRSWSRDPYLELVEEAADDFGHAPRSKHVEAVGAVLALGSGARQPEKYGRHRSQRSAGGRGCG